ncbi:MAG: acyl-[acyl-carrier-protein]--UDP-N-acetylglucosamine O-acyltransferase, partial [Simkaniaceae bacterium]|nr:acyl-[acyl-carrier-protein]--UDP-N-acetylglucosamine O-acyltransferase [Simkaniaceae bacterium]
CEVGNHVIMSNGAMLAGHVIIEDHAIIGGMTPIHQFCKIGCYAMVGGLSRITNDVPPYTIGAGSPYKLGGLNLIGLKRHKFPIEYRSELSKAFKLIYRSGLHFSEALALIETKLKKNEVIEHWIDFCHSSKRGLIGLQGVTATQDANEEGLAGIEDLLDGKTVSCN